MTILNAKNEQLHTYVNGVRHHNTPIGTLPGVTSVLGQTKSAFSARAITRWKARVGEQVSEGVQLNSTTRGNQLHATIEAFLGDTTPEAVNQQTIKLWKLVRPTIEDIKEKSSDLYIEKHTWHEDGYAGTPDLVACIDGVYTVFDWKNSRKPKKRSYISDYLMQVAAYAKSHEFTFGNKVEKAVIVCAVLPDEYLAVTDPGLSVKPELQVFNVTAKSLDTHWNNFSKRLAQYKELDANPDWFSDFQPF